MKRYYIPAIIILAVTLTACSAASTPPQANPQPASVSTAIPTPTDDPAILPTLFPNMNVNTNKNMTRLDEQGMVVVEITPLNLGTPAETLNFDVVLNTHSVDLSMDLATLATLTTDTGASVQAVSWDAPRGGHHVSGILIFPSIQDGKFILEGATKLTLTILDVDVPSRVFEWELI
ncbi:MAG: hypothetical protein DCC56_01500 [Anaerolineae bacterium]|nr:MAG: hypothetical protein DCC56_01500 [Anaerolineae bacterium]WKZ44713.1 MAG: hypothetical protein QY302_02840 [Anaerolineales bacterium]